MQFRVLGPVGARDRDGEELDLGGPQQRLVLALLLSQAGFTVSTDRLIDDIWGDEPPSTARKTIQGYVSGLRRALAPSDVLVSREPGYLLDVAGDQVDALRFEALVSSARQQLAADPEQGRSMLREALELWSGTPYEDLQDVDALRPEITRLDELRLVALEDRIHADVVCGDASVVVPELERLVRAHPLREELRVLLALALYRSGRQAEALRAIDDARRHMAEEIGVDPSPRMTLLEQRILDHDDALDGQRPLAPVGVQAEPVAAQPARNPYRGLRAFTEDDAADFFGRDELVRRLRMALERRTGPRLVMLAGPSGSGKSSVVRAGLLPSLIEEGRAVGSMYPGSQPSEALAEAVDELDGREPVLVVDQFEEVFALVSDPGESDAFLASLARLVTDTAGPWVVATIRADHLDELLGHPDLAPLLDEALMLVPPMSEHEIRAAVVGPAERVGVAVEPELVTEVIGDVASRAAALPLLQYALTDLFDRRDGGLMTRNAYRAAGGLLGALAGRADELYESLDEAGKESTRRALLRMVAISGEGEPVRKRVARAGLEDLPGIDRVLDVFGAHRLLTFDRAADGAPTVEVAHEALLRDWPLLVGWIEDARFDLNAHRRLTEAAAEWTSHDRNDDYLLTGTRLAQYGDWPPPDVVLAPTEESFLDAARARTAERRRTQRRRRRVSIALLAGAAVVALVLATIAFLGQREADRQRLAAEESGRAAEESRGAAEQSRQQAEENRSAAEASRARAESRALANAALFQVGEDPERALLLAVEAYAVDPEQVGPLLVAIGSVTARVQVLTEAAHDEGLATGPGGSSAKPRRVAGDLVMVGGPSGPVSQATLCAVELGPGRFVTKTDDSREAVIVDVPNGSVSRLPVSYGCRATASPAGDRLLGDGNRRDSRGGIRIIDATTGEELVATDPSVSFGEWGADGRILGYVVDNEGTVIREGSIPGTAVAEAGTLASGDETRITIPFNIFASNPRGELVWVDPDSGSIDPTGLMALYFGWSADGSRLLVTDADKGPGVVLPQLVRKTIHDSSSLEIVAEIGEVEPASATTAWSRDGRYVGDVSRSGTIRVWDAATGASVVNRETGEDAVEGAWLAFSPRGDLAALARRRVLDRGHADEAPGEVTFFELPTGQPIGSPVTFSEEIAATSFIGDTELAVVRATGIVEVVDPATNPLVDTSLDLTTVAARQREVDVGAPGGLRLFPDQGDYVATRDGSDVRVVDLGNGEEWVVDGVAAGSLGRWVRTDGSLVIVADGFEMVVYDRSGVEVSRGFPFGRIDEADGNYSLVTRDGDVVAAAVVSRADQFGNPVELTTGVIDLATLEPIGITTPIQLTPGSTSFYLGPDRVVAYNFGRGILETLALDGTEVAPDIEPGYEILDVVVSADGAQALLHGPEATAIADLDTGTIVSTASVSPPAPGVLLPDGKAVFALADGRLGFWSTTPLELLGVLSERDPAASAGFVVFDGEGHIWFDTGSRLERISVDPKVWAERACELAGRDLLGQRRLTQEEWVRFVSPDRPYAPAC